MIVGWRLLLRCSMCGRHGVRRCWGRGSEKCSRGGRGPKVVCEECTWQSAAAAWRACVLIVWGEQVVGTQVLSPPALEWGLDIQVRSLILLSYKPEEVQNLDPHNN